MADEKNFFDFMFEENRSKKEKIPEGVESFWDLIEINERGKKASFVESFYRIFF